ncbi:MAG: type II toxin-antitoxin system HicA family toxin [Candidatus Pacearchaeota archaeon]|nr:type II toxin-antitoxin system HicA family toxin [Candidatus Pacearchaeota archaeon]
MLSANEIIKILQKMGFQRIRQEGSHVFLQHPDGRTTVVPNHPGEDVDRGLLNKILKKDLGIEREDFLKYL